MVLLGLPASALINQVAQFPGRHVVMIRFVFHNDRSQSTSPQTVNVLNGKEPVGSDTAEFYSELASGLVREKTSTSDMARSAIAHRDNVLAGRIQPEGLIEGSHSVYFHQRDPEIVGQGLNHLFGNVTVVLLNVQECLDELTRLATASV